jgi:hypothetical protein
MSVLVTNSSWARRHTDAKSIFGKLAEHIDASVIEFNVLRGGHGLHCEWTTNRIAVCKDPYPRITVELEFDKIAGTVRIRRQKQEGPCSGEAGATVTDVHCAVDRKNKVYLDRADYCRLARQVLRPLMDAFE